MGMQYFKTAQYVPGKGEAWMYYECDNASKVLRTVSHIPSTGEVERNDDPIVKRLIFPERLMPATSEEFEAVWGSGG